MKYLSILLAALLAACTETELPKSVTDAVPARYDINDPVFAHAKTELTELVEACGPGVVEGAKDDKGEIIKSRCSYTVKMDDTFFRHPATKTGLLHDPDWAYRDGVTWFTPRREAVPENFDLREHMKNGQPVIKQQQCGDCWAWATHHGYEIAQAVHDGKVVDDSVQSVLSCSKQGSCGGGYMSAVDFIKNGLPLEGIFPYLNGSTGKCKFNSTELATGWDPKVIATPYIGTSLSYSRALKSAEGEFLARPSVQEMKAAMHQWKAPLVVTVAAYSASGPGVVDSCSSINSGGNHMVTIVGWDGDNAHVWNSWGQGHGEKGVSRIKWECGPGRLNRGLGVSAKVVQYKSPCTPPDVKIGQTKYVLFSGNSIKLGNRTPGQTCKWSPAEGLSDPNSCETYASPSISTEYHLVSTNDCGTASAMTFVEVWGPRGPTNKIRTPHGVLTMETK